MARLRAKELRLIPCPDGSSARLALRTAWRDPGRPGKLSADTKPRFDAGRTTLQMEPLLFAGRDEVGKRGEEVLEKGRCMRFRGADYEA